MQKTKKHIVALIFGIITSLTLLISLLCRWGILGELFQILVIYGSFLAVPCAIVALILGILALVYGIKNKQVGAIVVSIIALALTSTVCYSTLIIMDMLF